LLVVYQIFQRGPIVTFRNFLISKGRTKKLEKNKFIVLVFAQPKFWIVKAGIASLSKWIESNLQSLEMVVLSFVLFRVKKKICSILPFLF
jgi:hypothetical protein